MKSSAIFVLHLSIIWTLSISSLVHAEAQVSADEDSPAAASVQERLLFAMSSKGKEIIIQVNDGGTSAYFERCKVDEDFFNQTWGDSSFQINQGHLSCKVKSSRIGASDEATMDACLQPELVRQIGKLSDDDQHDLQTAAELAGGMAAVIGVTNADVAVSSNFICESGACRFLPAVEQLSLRPKLSISLGIAQTIITSVVGYFKGKQIANRKTSEMTVEAQWTHLAQKTKSNDPDLEAKKQNLNLRPIMDILWKALDECTTKITST
jgi:hypothetical protein